LSPPALLVAACRVVVGGLFVSAALTKVPDLHLFAEEIANYQLLPAALVPLAAITLPGVELLAGVLLVLGLAWRPAALVLTVLLAGFTAGLTQALVRGIDLNCGCFGGSDPATPLTVARDAALLGAVLVVLRWGPGRPAATDR
jgi:uncharacterized membrane protein YphA (DoxX/SURF4 family)